MGVNWEILEVRLRFETRRGFSVRVWVLGEFRSVISCFIISQRIRIWVISLSWSEG